MFSFVCSLISIISSYLVLLHLLSICLLFVMSLSFKTTISPTVSLCLLYVILELVCFHLIFVFWLFLTVWLSYVYLLFDFLFCGMSTVCLYYHLSCLLLVMVRFVLASDCLSLVCYICALSYQTFVGSLFIFYFVLSTVWYLSR